MEAALFVYLFNKANTKSKGGRGKSDHITTAMSFLSDVKRPERAF
jgi:hypothetical protein